MFVTETLHSNYQHQSVTQLRHGRKDEICSFAQLFSIAVPAASRNSYGNMTAMDRRWIAGGSPVDRQWIAGGSPVDRRWVAGGSPADAEI